EAAPPSSGGTKAAPAVSFGRALRVSFTTTTPKASTSAPPAPSAYRCSIVASNRSDEDFALFGAVRRSDEPPLFHDLDDARGAIVPEVQLALQPRGRAPVRVGDDAHRLVVERVELGVVVL